jgi:F0F1-type ATP synthase assembly protein I
MESKKGTGITPVNDKPDDSQPLSPEAQKVKKYSSNTALALELPFTIVGAVLVGGVVGYFLDHWLHTRWVFTMILGGVGFAGGVREVIRRLD